jgi:hypothetical protein
MHHYDPEKAPDPGEWLALDEQERIILAEDYHRRARIELPNLQVHAVIHAVVENQIAEGLEPVIQAMNRLVRQGVTRHSALHAIGLSLFEYLNELVGSDSETKPALDKYCTALEEIEPDEWL